MGKFTDNSDEQKPTRYYCQCGKPYDISIMLPEYRKGRLPDTPPPGTKFYCWPCWDQVKKPDWRDRMINEMIGERNG